MELLQNQHEEYSMKELVNLVGNMAVNTNEFQKVFGVQMKQVTEDVHQLTGKVGVMEADINYLKNDVHLTHSQRKTIAKAVSDRVFKLLEIPREAGSRTKEQQVIASKYSHIFHQRCRRDVSKKGHLMIPDAETPNKFFDEAIKDIEAWIPHGGVMELIKEADDKAVARMIAKQQGY